MPPWYPADAVLGTRRSRRAIIGFLALALAVAGLVAAAGHGPPSAKAAAGGNALLTNEKLLPGQSLFSPGGITELQMQGDGNLVLSIASRPGTPRTAWWATNTNQAGSWLENQSDGNIVLHAPDGATIWTTRTGNCAGARLEVTDAPDWLDVFGADGSRLFWVYEWHNKHSTFSIHYGKKTAASCPPAAAPVMDVVPPAAPEATVPAAPVYSSESD
jgi:hypothetical protein